MTIPVDFVPTTVPKLTGELKGDKWFDATKYPSAEFTSTKVTLAGKASAIISGTLTLHGVTKPITLKAHLVGAGINPIDKAYTVGFSATGTIKRSAFGVSAYVPYIGDDVRLTIAGAFESSSKRWSRSHAQREATAMMRLPSFFTGLWRWVFSRSSSSVS